MTRTSIVTGLSDIGCTRTRNEDSVTLLPELGVAVVADGMGGHPGGDVASRVAASEAASSLGERVGPHLDRSQDALDELRSAMAESVAAAHMAIRGEVQGQEELEGMGTTVTALVVDLETRCYVIGHVGDSRAYRLRDETLTQLTRDDTWVQDRVDNGELTQEQADRHPFGHILTQCVGLTDPPTVHVLDGQIEEGDLFVLCTDGLVGMVSDERVAEILNGNVGTPPTEEGMIQAADELVEAAKEAGGYDNITVSLVAERLG